MVGSDAQTDLALLAVSDGDLQLATLGSSTPLRVGQTVIAVSATRGLHYRVGINVVSDRDVMVDAGTGIDVAGLLETGITVSPDMAGGALVDRDGTVVGILTYAAAPGAERPRHPGRERARRGGPTRLERFVGQGGPRLARACWRRTTTPTGPAAARRSTTCSPAARPRRQAWSPAT